MSDLIYRLRYPARSWTQHGGSQLDMEETASDMREAADEIEEAVKLLDDLLGLEKDSGDAAFKFVERYRAVVSSQKEPS